MTLFEQATSASKDELVLCTTIPWTPRAKERPRFTKTGHSYTSAPTRAAEKAIKEEFQRQFPDWEPLDGPIALSLALANDHFNIAIHRVGEHTQRKLRGDLDNYEKTIGDALNEVAYIDDRQIVRMLGEKL